ncbi:hypothetical protein A8C32_01180 [Flavivirga aquatica]|uniref:Uncharacterized protein n=1 Tax=Flavivirga aquatica TaxID=1849968 RepID=A0A1E5T9R2_9FLAO|nr:hypothetical protein [Flavivirga aquatica]OEK08101.1 hypothetical protein A8C32_01180 [Flavivirga aquatica]
MKKIFFALFLVIALKSVSQEKYSSETYRVTLGDIETRTYKKDSTEANAIVIFEEGKSYVHTGDYDLRTEEKHKIKILNKEGFSKC